MVFNRELRSAVEEFAMLVLPLSEKDLEREWIWKDHDEEGIRFAFFVTLQELRDLAVALASARPKLTTAQHILAQYHGAYMDMQAVLLGVSNADAEREPGEGEWSVQRAYAHILGTEINFSITVRYALEGHRAGRWSDEQISGPDEERLAGISEQEYQVLVSGPLSTMREYHRQLHQTIIEEFSQVTDEEIELPATFWEKTRFPIRHRLHRYEAHFVQHTVQIDKTLAAIGMAPGESKQLLRKIYAALAEAEGFMIAATKMDEAATLATASSISERTIEIKSLMQE